MKDTISGESPRMIQHDRSGSQTPTKERQMFRGRKRPIRFSGIGRSPQADQVSEQVRDEQRTQLRDAATEPEARNAIITQELNDITHVLDYRQRRYERITEVWPYLERETTRVAVVREFLDQVPHSNNERSIERIIDEYPLGELRDSMRIVAGYYSVEHELDRRIDGIDVSRALPTSNLIDLEAASDIAQNIHTQGTPEEQQLRDYSYSLGYEPLSLSNNAQIKTFIQFINQNGARGKFFIRDNQPSRELQQLINSGQELFSIPEIDDNTKVAINRVVNRWTIGAGLAAIRARGDKPLETPANPPADVPPESPTPQERAQPQTVHPGTARREPTPEERVWQGPQQPLLPPPREAPEIHERILSYEEVAKYFGTRWLAEAVLGMNGFTPSVDSPDPEVLTATHIATERNYAERIMNATLAAEIAADRYELTATGNADPETGRETAIVLDAIIEELQTVPNFSYPPGIRGKIFPEINSLLRRYRESQNVDTEEESMVVAYLMKQYLAPHAQRWDEFSPFRLGQILATCREEIDKIPYHAGPIDWGNASVPGFGELFNTRFHESPDNMRIVLDLASDYNQVRAQDLPTRMRQYQHGERVVGSAFDRDLKTTVLQTLWKDSDQVPERSDMPEAQPATTPPTSVVESPATIRDENPLLTYTESPVPNETERDRFYRLLQESSE